MGPSGNSDQENNFVPGIEYLEMMEHYESLALEAQNFRSEEEIEEYMSQFIGLTNEEVRSITNPPEKNLANIDALRAFHLPREESVQMCRDILDVHPDCIEAYICMAGWENDSREVINLLQKALECGENQFDMDKYDGHRLWWTDIRTRPYMRALYLCALEEMHRGDFESGYDLLWELLEMDENDNISARYPLAEAALLKRRWQDISKLDRLFPDDSSCTFKYTRAFRAFAKNGRNARTRKLFTDAFESNSLPFGILIGQIDVDQLYGRMDLDRVVEVHQISNIISRLFNADHKMMAWITKAYFDWEIKPSHN